ncbi:MAG: lipopolysaccharide biosynthesis protein [Prevotella sp.]|nr:lipopolysaccharide biosynthesis protein [Prevotella sp.]
MAKEQGIRYKAASVMKWTAVSTYSSRIIKFISEVILARLLTPYDFGCIGMLAMFVGLSETFIDSGFGSALIQKKNATQVDYSTIFYFNLSLSVVLYMLLFACAPAIARFYEISELSDVLRVQALILFLYAFNLIQTNQLKKKLNFKILAIISVISSITALVICIVLAYMGFGVWALVVRNLVSRGLRSLFLWFYVKWRPILVFSWKSLRELFGFGMYMMLTHLFTNMSSYIQTLLVGKIYSPEILGFYTKADGAESLASRSISKVIVRASYPLYAKMQDDKATLQNMVKRFTMTLSYFTFPALFILLLVAKPFFILLFTEKWLVSVPYFQMLCIAGLAQCLQSVNMQTISATGKSRVTFTWTVIKRAFSLMLIIGGLIIWGMKGLLCGVVINHWLAYFVNIGLVSKYIGYKWYRQLLDLLPVTIATIIIAVITFVCVEMLHLTMYADAVVKIILYIILYSGWSHFFKPEAFSYSKVVIHTFKDTMSSKKTKKSKA